MKTAKILFRSLGFFFVALVFIWVIVPVSADAEIYSQVLRLHVLADSDEEEAQAMKLRVRDALLTYSEDLLADCTDREEAISVLSRNRKKLEDYVNRCLEQWGAAYSATVKLGTEHYDTREYEGFRLPAGEYFSLRVILGEGKGKNWWCVLFPPVCLTCAQAEDQLVASGVKEDSVKVFTVDSGEYRFRFRLLEFFGSLFGK